MLVVVAIRSQLAVVVVKNDGTPSDEFIRSRGLTSSIQRLVRCFIYFKILFMLDLSASLSTCDLSILKRQVSAGNEGTGLISTELAPYKVSMLIERPRGMQLSCLVVDLFVWK